MPELRRAGKYSKKLTHEICRRLAEGETLRGICRDPQMPDKSTVLRWLSRYPAFAVLYAQARVLQADHWAEEILEIADDSVPDWEERESGRRVANTEHLQRSKLRVDTRKWLMARMAPKKYGEKTLAAAADSIVPDLAPEIAAMSPAERTQRLLSLLQRARRRSE